MVFNKTFFDNKYLTQAKIKLNYACSFDIKGNKLLS